jgi:hypothetical protein
MRQKHKCFASKDDRARAISKALNTLTDCHPAKKRRGDALGKTTNIGADSSLSQGSDTAKTYGIDLKSIRLAQECLAMSKISKAIDMLEAWTKDCTDVGDAVLAVHAELNFDTAKIKITLPLTVDGVRLITLESGTTA